MVRKSISVMLILAVLFSLALYGCGGKKDADSETTAAVTTDGETTAAGTESTAAAAGISKDDIKVGFVYVGPIGDGGWTFAHNEGRLYLEKELGVKTVYKESVSDQNADSEKVMKDMIDQGCNVIFATSYGYMDHVEKVAKEYPNVKFFHCSGYKMGDNFANYFGRMYQPRYLSGVVAAMKTKTNVLGFVAAYEIPEVVSGINAFTLGARSVNPDIKVVVKWTHTWYDPAKEKDAAKALLDEGADVIAQHQDTTGPQLAAEERGLWAIGYNTDSSKAVPKAFMTAPIWNWGPYYVEQIQAIIDGTWKSSAFYGGMKEGIIDLAPLTAVAPEGAQAKVDEVKAKILDGTFKVFEGPLKDQTGAVKVESGKFMSDEEILNMMWFVEGVEGKIETK